MHRRARPRGPDLSVDVPRREKGGRVKAMAPTSGRPLRGFVRLSAAVPMCRVADTSFNAQRTIEVAARAHGEGAQVVVFPELGITGYTARDLFQDFHLLDAAVEGWPR